jgi:hypothetical protein
MTPPGVLFVCDVDDHRFIRRIMLFSSSKPLRGRKATSLSHDAVMFSGVTDIGMLFVRCGNGGISHSPLETVMAADADVAARILIDTITNFEPAHDR